LGNDLLNIARNCLYDYVDSRKKAFTAGAGLDAPTPWSPKGGLLRVDYSSGLYDVLSEVAREGFPMSSEGPFMSKLASVAASTAGQIGRLLDLDPSRAVCGSPLRPHIISGLLKALGYDEEAKALREELDLGFSMGDVSSIPESQLWPKAKRNPQLDVRRVFDNYQSATDKEEVLLKIINQEVNSNRMRPFDPSNGPGDCVFTPMALIPKGVDENSTDPKKLLLSKVIHDDASDQSICFFVVDIESAYRQALDVLDIYVYLSGTELLVTTSLGLRERFIE
ncbi:hypothetical protein FOZ61_001325, partial [Perkinsus olseni]